MVALVQNTVELEEIRQAAQAQEEAGLPWCAYVSEVPAALQRPEAWAGFSVPLTGIPLAGVPPARVAGQDLHGISQLLWGLPLHRKQLFAALASGKPERVRKLLDTILQGGPAGSPPAGRAYPQPVCQHYRGPSPLSGGKGSPLGGTRHDSAHCPGNGRTASHAVPAR